MSLWNRMIAFLGYYGPRDIRGTQYPIPLKASQTAAADVDFDTSMQVSAFWACVRLITDTCASLPLEFYNRGNGAAATPNDLWLARLFSGRINRFQNRHEFFATMALNLCVHGNCYARITRGDDGRIISLLPLMAPQMEVRTLEDGSVAYLYYTDQGTVAYAAESIWHVKLFGNNTIGLSPLGHARNSLAIAIASEKRVNQVFLNGAKPTGVLMYDKVLKAEQRDQIRQSFKDLAEGNNDSLIVLEAGMKYEQVSMSPQDIELLASRRFQIEDIARFMGVPSVLINDTAGSTTWGSGIQQIIAGWYKLGLRPYLERFETSIEVSLLTDEERMRWEPEFDFDELLRADFGARMEGYQKGINAGVITPNEARGEEGRLALPGGDQLLVNGNMMPADMAGQQPANKPQFDQILKTAEALQLQIAELGRKSEPSAPVHVHLPPQPKLRHIADRDVHGRIVALRQVEES
ncbi:MAG TPA: phage portal protein [Steroidobacteraceae bacterium]|nr:phage portal protein [Steroidobacteraceae bacterium]